LFITLEGVEGCGKSTQARLLARRLEKEGYLCLLTREPGGTPIGQEIRQVILHPRHHQMSPEAELGLYFSDRAQHLREVVWPAIAAGKIVVCDRFTDSTIAYQGYGRKLSLRMIRSLDRIMTGTYRPNVTLFLDLPIEAGLERARARNHKEALLDEGRFEAEEIEFHERVRAGYMKMVRREPDRFIVVPVEGNKKKVQESVWKAVKTCIRRRRKTRL
jgi:dTMP kinase